MNIIPVDREHFPIWKNLRSALFSGLDDSFYDREMEWIFTSEDKWAFLFETGDGVAVGLLELSLRNIVDGCIGSPVGYVEGVYLQPEFRGSGYGRRLMEFAEQWFRQQGCREMATDAEIDNLMAQEFYRRAGFVEGWRIVEYRKPII